MALLGSSVDPRLFVQDYSGFTRAADIQGQSMANIGSDIGGIAKQFGEYKKQQSEQEKRVKSAELVANAIAKSFPTLAPVAMEAQMIMGDKNNSLQDRVAAADAVEKALNIGISNAYKEREFGLQKRQLDIEEGQGIQAALMKQAELKAKANEPTKLKPRTITLGPDDAVDVLGDDYGNIYDPKSKLRIVNFDGYVAGKALEETTVSDDTNGLPPFSQYGSDIRTNTGEVLPDRVLQSSAGQQEEVDAGGAAYPDGVAVAGTPLAGVTTPIATERTTSQSVAELDGPTYTPIPQPRDPVAIQKAVDLTSGGATSGLTPRSRKVNREPLVRVNTGDDPQQQRETAIDKSLIETKTEAAQVASQLAKIEEISKLLDEGVNTGFAQNVLMQGKRIFGQDVSNQEAFKAASGNVALGFINLTKGAISDREMQYFTEVLAPSIGTSVEGNKKIVEFLRKAADKAAKVEGIISNGMRSGKSAFDIDDEVQKFRNTEAIGPKEVGGMNEIYNKHGVQ
jgi:hypothetical protein